MRAIHFLKNIEKFSAIELSDKVEQGFPFAAYLDFQYETGFSRTDMAGFLGVSVHYLKVKAINDKLTKHASERLFKLNEVWVFGLTCFNGNKKDFNQWPHTSLAPLHGRIPLQLLTNFIGMEEVRQLLGRIQHVCIHDLEPY
ncbi:MAG: DUF2384 domain-containing protein [Flammeovirgaceae bacterium]|nr:DUF2384 domain-containing protein [Flammeovirgaceae bacterium]